MKVRHVQGAKDDEKVSPDILDIFLNFYIPRNRAVRLLAVLSKLIPRLFSLSSSRLSSSGVACSRKAAFRRWGASWIVRGENKLGKNEGKLGLGLGLGTVPSLASPGFFLRTLLLSTWNRLSQESILDFEAHTQRQSIVFDYNYKLYSSLVFSLTESLQ